VALLGETIDQVRAVMVEGESGLMAVTPSDRRPAFRATRNRLVWPNGAEAMLVSAANPEALRGPQFDCAWSDELAKWKRCREAWDMLQFCLRLGARTRQVVTTTPRDNDVLVEIMGEAASVVTHAGTEANRANLAPDFLARLRARHAGTMLGRQELDGELVRGREGAFWTPAMIDAARETEAPDLDRVVVAVDPPVTAGENADECGIVVAGVSRKGEPSGWKVYVLADLSCGGQSPRAWAGIAAEAYRVFQADRLVAEVNQGGDLVESVMRQVDPQISYRAVRASRGKRVRAEPVAALYEQGRVRHVGCFPELESQMCRFVAASRGGIKSPDRLDAGLGADGPGAGWRRDGCAAGAQALRDDGTGNWVCTRAPSRSDMEIPKHGISIVPCGRDAAARGKGVCRRAADGVPRHRAGGVESAGLRLADPQRLRAERDRLPVGAHGGGIGGGDPAGAGRGRGADGRTPGGAAAGAA
jgi:phage terminase large subunit-like protein